MLVVAMLMATMLFVLPMSASAAAELPTGTVAQTADFYTIGTTSAANISTGGFKESGLFFKVTPGESYKIHIDKLTTIFYQQADFASWTTPAAIAENKFPNLTNYALDTSSGCASPRMIVYAAKEGEIGSAISGFENYSLYHTATYCDLSRSNPSVANYSTADLWLDRQENMQYSSFTINFTAPEGVNEICVVFAAGDFLSSVLCTPGDSLTLKVESVMVTQNFDEVSVDLGEDIALNYYAPATAGNRVEFTVGDETKTVAGVAVDGEQNKFTLHLAPQQISENVKAVLYNGTTATKASLKYSVKQYMNELKANYSTDAELCALADAVIAYGAAATDFVEENTEAVALTNNVAVNSDFVLTGNGNAATFTSGNVFFDDTNDLIFAYENAKAGVEWKVNGNATGFVQTTGKVTVENLMPTGFDTVYTVTATAGDDVTTVSYSVNAYCYAIANKDGAAVYAKNLAIATYNYGVAAEAYIATRT